MAEEVHSAVPGSSLGEDAYLDYEGELKRVPCGTITAAIFLANRQAGGALTAVACCAGRTWGRRSNWPSMSATFRCRQSR